MKIIRPAIISNTGTFTRASTGTYYDSAGILQTAGNDVPRFTYNPINLAAGPYLLLEAAATNLVLNSATLVTQSITTIVATYTLSFFGIGTVTLSGTATGSVTGTSASVRTILTFLATAGSLTLTVVGSCTTSQLELGSAATSYIATTGTTATRAADVNTAMLVSNIPENDFPVWNAGTTYALGDSVLLLSNNKIYQSAAAGNVGHAPPNTTYWIDAGYDNRWRMFDQSVTSQTSQATSVIVAITPGIRLDSVVGLNCAAAIATINMVDPQAGLVYSKSVSLTSFSGIQDWFAYYYEPVVQLTEFLLTDLPVSFPNATTTVAITATTAAIGGLVLGFSRELGISEWGAKPGIIDYSVKTKDNFGNYNIVARNFSKRLDVSVQVPTNSVDATLNMLAGYRSIPIVYVGSNAGAPQQFNSTIIYGFYKDLSFDISYNAFSVMTLQIEGLT